MPKAGGKWNTYEITAKGSQLTVVLNGVQTADIQHSQFARDRSPSSMAAAQRKHPAARSSGARCKSSRYSLRRPSEA